MGHEVVILRNPASAEEPGALGRVRSFYERNPREGVRPRPQDMIERAFDEKAIFSLETPDDTIVGIGVRFAYLDGDYKEIGGDLIIVNGFGLQKLLVVARTVADHLFDPSEGPMCAIASPETASHRTLEKLWFRPCQPDRDLFAARARALGVEPSLGGKTYFELDQMKLPCHARELMDWYENPMRHKSARAGGTNDTATVHFDLPLLTDESLQAVRALAARADSAEC